jgi:hypothetical protein
VVGHHELAVPEEHSHVQVMPGAGLLMRLLVNFCKQCLTGFVRYIQVDGAALLAFGEEHKPSMRCRCGHTRPVHMGGTLNCTCCRGCKVFTPVVVRT